MVEAPCEWVIEVLLYFILMKVRSFVGGLALNARWDADLVSHKAKLLVNRSMTYPKMVLLYCSLIQQLFRQKGSLRDD